MISQIFLILSATLKEIKHKDLAVRDHGLRWLLQTGIGKLCDEKRLLYKMIKWHLVGKEFILPQEKVIQNQCKFISMFVLVSLENLEIDV